ncbi:MAG: DUF4031 domain-containing protein [Acidimicrobiaceae bacterium]|nr:DUF4031 domain-containing protein [Acidimicrobiaceae bacterium]
MILVDRPIWHFKGKRWSHLVSDHSYEELHSFAGALGVPRRAFQGDHYDIPEEYVPLALDLGAHQVDPRQLLARLKAAGLRVYPHQRSGDR